MTYHAETETMPSGANGSAGAQNPQLLQCWPIVYAPPLEPG
jgi:hypothetical protein